MGLKKISGLYGNYANLWGLKKISGLYGNYANLWGLKKINGLYGNYANLWDFMFYLMKIQKFVGKSQKKATDKCNKSVKRC